MKTSYSREGSGTIDLNARNGLWDYLYYDAGYRGFYVNLYYGVDTDGTGLPYEFCRATWDVIFKEINENRPVILNYHDHEVDSDKKRNGHSAVAYSCIIEQDPDSGRYQNINLTIRTGWLRPPKVYWLADVPTTKSVSAVNFSLTSIITVNIWY